MFAAKAVRLLAELVGRNRNETMRIMIEKHIPAEAGLGGGSSDAAAALVGAAKLWGISPDDERIEEAARRLGADVAFFLRGGCACLTGVGDVLVKPEGGVSTREAYRAFDESPQHIDALDSERALSAAHAVDVPLRNNLVSASEGLLPVLADVREWMCAQDADVAEVLMSGSGSAVFAVCRDFAAACRVSSAARKRGWWSRTTTFGPARAAAVPTR